MPRGRPPAVAGGRTVNICVRYSETETKKLDRLAKRKGLTRSQYVRIKSLDEEQK